MTRPSLRTGNVAAGAILLGGALALIFPQHVVSIVQVVTVTIAAAAGIHALARHVPPTGWMHPLRWMSPFGDAGPAARRSRGPDDLRRIRATLRGRRQRIRGAPALPPDIIRLLRPLIRSALDLAPDEPLAPGRIGDRLSPSTRAILLARPLDSTPFIWTRRSHERKVALAVNEVLDEIERLAEGAYPPSVTHPRIMPGHP